jgi:hypothetical protein
LNAKPEAAAYFLGWISSWIANLVLITQPFSIEGILISDTSLGYKVLGKKMEKKRLEKLVKKWEDF